MTDNERNALISNLLKEPIKDWSIDYNTLIPIKNEIERVFEIRKNYINALMGENVIQYKSILKNKIIYENTYYTPSDGNELRILFLFITDWLKKEKDDENSTI